MDITFKKADTLKNHPQDSALGFGTIFTDYMFNMDYNPEAGWHNPRIEPYGPIAMDPSTMVLHYGQAIFEGLKAYRTESGDIQLFRPKIIYTDSINQAIGCACPNSTKLFSRSA